MPVHLRALVVILFLAIVTFAFAKAPACAMAMTRSDFERRRNVWLAITLTAFLAHNFWIYIVITAAILLFTIPRESNKLALYFFILFVIPPFSQKITGLGVINYFFEINYIRLLSLLILLPAFLSIQKQPHKISFGKTLPDKFIIAFITLQCGLALSASTFTDTLRTTVFYQFLDVFLPYYVASRYPINLEKIREAVIAFCIAALVMSALGVFETIRHWLLYASLPEAQGFDWSWGNYLMRNDSGLRAQVSTGHPIVLGYVIAVAFGFFLYAHKTVMPTLIWRIGFMALIAGLIAPLSRGPWVGAAVMLIAFTASGEKPLKQLTKMAVFCTLLISTLLITPFGDQIISLLPFFGSIENENITYRQRLLEIGIGVILQNPFFGAYDFFMSTEAQELKQGNGTIDLVNTYLAIGLGSGLTGLFSFLGFFLSIIFLISKKLKKINDKKSELYILGQSLISTIIGILVIIFTVSSILVVPVIYWAIAGLGVAYSCLPNSPKKENNPETSTKIPSH